MQLSISNIAWDITHDEAIAELLIDEGIHCIDIAPGKYFSNFAKTSREDIARVRCFWESRGIKIIGMQSLFFGTKNLNLFNVKSQPAMLQHLKAVRNIAVQLGVERMTFGSPKNRDKTGLTDNEANNLAKAFFRHWSDIKDSYQNPRLLIEPNPTIYGANFLTTTQETLDFVKELSMPDVGLQLDLGTMTANCEPSELIDYSAPFIGHVHISEPWLVPIGSTNAPHELYAQKLRAANPNYLTIEMVVPESDCQISIVRNAIEFVKRVYREALS